MGCTDNIIGLSRTECPCYDTGKPTDYNTSKSGLFLDEIEGMSLNMVYASEDCSNESLWGIMDRARSSALIELRGDLNSCLGIRNDVKRKAFLGEIGKRKFTGTTSVSGSFAGIRIQTNDIRGGSLIIDSIGVLMNATGSFNLFLYSNEDFSTPLQTFTVNSSSNSYNNNAITPITLKLDSDICEDLEYYLVYDANAGFLPLNNKSECEQCNKGKGSTTWIDVRAISGDTITEMDSWGSTTLMNGLTINGELKCAVSDLFCKEEFDFENDGRAATIAHSIRYKTAQLVMDRVTSLPDITRYTMLMSEQLKDYASNFRHEYNNRIGVICDNTDISLNDCLVCDNKRFAVNKLLV